MGLDGIVEHLQFSQASCAGCTIVFIDIQCGNAAFSNMATIPGIVTKSGRVSALPSFSKDNL